MTAVAAEWLYGLVTRGRNTTVDGSGNINWNPQVRDLPNGTYEFSLMSRDAWGTSSNLNNVNEHDYEFGKMYVTVSDTIDECEFYLDLSKDEDLEALKTVLTDLETLYGALEGEDKTSFADLEAAYADRIEAAEAAIAAAEADANA